jgi:hypothetical protein
VGLLLRGLGETLDQRGQTGGDRERVAGRDVPI